MAKRRKDDPPHDTGPAYLPLLDEFANDLTIRPWLILLIRRVRPQEPKVDFYAGNPITRRSAIILGTSGMGPIRFEGGPGHNQIMAIKNWAQVIAMPERTTPDLSIWDYDRPITPADVMYKRVDYRCEKRQTPGGAIFFQYEVC